MAYTSDILVSNYLQRDLTEHEKAYLMVLIPAIKVWLDRKLDTTFDEVVETTRYFDGGTAYLDVDNVYDITDVDSVNEDNTEGYDYTDLTEYIAEPVNETVKTQLIKRSGKFPKGVGNIKVTGKFSGYADGVPQDIQLIATMLAAGALVQSATAGSGDVVSESLEGHSVTYSTSDTSLEGISSTNPAIMSLLDGRRELLLG